MLCLSPAQAHIALLYIQGGKKNHNIIRTGVNCLVSSTGLSGLGQGLHIIHISPPETCFCVWTVCRAAVLKINKRCFQSISELEMVCPGSGHFSLWLISGYCGQGDDAVMVTERLQTTSHPPGPIMNTALRLLNVPPGESEQINHRPRFALTLLTIFRLSFNAQITSQTICNLTLETHWAQTQTDALFMLLLIWMSKNCHFISLVVFSKSLV